MATEVDISDLISPMKIEAEDEEHNSGNSKIIKEELFEVNEGIVKSIEGDTFLQSPSFIDGEVERNTEDNQLNSIRKINGSQNGDKIDMKKDENNSNPASEHKDCSQGTTFDIEKVGDVCPLKEKRDDTLTAEAILSQQDSTETSFKEEDGSQNKSSESPLTEKVDSIEISKQEIDHEAKDIVDDNLNDKSEALGIVEMLVTEAPGEIETTSPSETPDQNPAKDDVTTISGDIKVFATPEEKNHAAIELDEKNEAEVAVTDSSGDDTNATSPLVVDEEQIISEKLNQVSIVETEGQGLMVLEGEGNSSNEVIQTTKHFDKNADDHTIKEEEFEESKVTNEREKIDEDINKETLTVPAIECNREDVTSGIRENITVANIGDEEEPAEPSTLEEPENKIENDTEKSENVSSLVSQALKEEVYEAKMEDTKNYVEKADTAPPRILETTSLAEVEPFDKPLEEASIMKAHLPEYEIENEYLDRAEDLSSQSESHVQAVQDIYEITRSPNVEESNANEIEKIIREVPEELSEADNNGENGESETKTQDKDKTGLEGSDAVSESKDQNIEEIHETKTSISAVKNEEVSENNEAETSKSKREPDFHGIEEIKEVEAPIAEQIPMEEEKDKLNPVAETGNTVDEIENETTEKTETELINPDADEDKEEKLSELSLEPNVQCVEGIDEIEPKPLVSQTQEGKETEELKDVPEAVFESTAQNVEEVNETSAKEGQIEKLNREAPEESSEPTNQVVEAVNTEETVTPTVAFALTSSKEFQLNEEAEDVADPVSSEKNKEMTEKADSSQQDEGVEKIIPEDASTSVSDYAHEDVKIESESAKIDEEVGEARTPITKHEYKDQVVEDAQETDLSSDVDERNINEIAKVEKDVTGELPEAINEDVEAETEGSPDQEITKSIAKDVQEAKASVPVIQSKALSVEEMDGFDPTHSNFQGVGTIIDEEVLPNQTLLIESEEQLMKPCSTLVDDQHRETTTEVEMVKSESINKNDTRLNEDTADLLETGTTGYEVQRELDISNSDVAVQESQNEATEKEIDEESIDEKMKCGEGESKLINDQINAFGTSSETTIAETIETVDTTTQDSEVDSTKIQETSNVESQLLSHENEKEACERTTEENEDTENLEAENSKDCNVEEIHDTDTSPALENTETSEIHNKIREVPRVINQVYEADSSDENAHGQKIQAENLEAPEAFSEPTNQVVEGVSNDDFTAPTVATELTSSKEFQLGGAPENVTNSSAENIKTTEKADSIQQDEGIEKIVLEDASNAVSEYVQENEEKDGESFKVDEEVGEARTVVTISENKDQVVEHARETDLSSAVDESNVNEIDGEVERNTEANQLNSIRKMNGPQNGDKIDMKTDEINSNPASEHTDCSQGTTFDTEKVSDVCPLKEKRDDTLTAEAILSQQDSTETSFKEEDGSQNKSSESLLTEKVESIEISKQELDHEAKNIVEDNLNDKSEALGNVEMLVTEAPEEIETTSPSDTPDQNPAKEDVTTIAGDIKVFASPEEKNHAAIGLDEKNEEAEVAVTDNSGDDTITTSPLVVDEEQIISEKLNQVSIVETEGQYLKVSEGFKGEQEGNSSNEVIQTTKHFDKISDDQIIKEEEFEEPKVTNAREEIEEDINKETLTVPAIECNCEDVTSGIQENKTVANIGDEEELEEPSTLEEPKNIENDTEKSENVSSLVSQTLKEEVYEVEMEDTKNYAEKADTAPPRILETTSLAEVEPFDKPLEEASIMKAHLPEHEIENEDLERAENLNAQSESHVQAVQDVYEITRSPNVEESAANEIEKIIREVPKELTADNNGENGESETKTQVEDKTELESSDAVSESKDQNISVSAVKNEEVSENNEAETSKSKKEPDFHGIEEIQAPIAGQIPTEEEKAELNPVPEIGNTVDEIQNETTDKTETELINPDVDEDKEEKLSELALEPNIQCVEEIDEIKPKPLVSQTQEGKEAEELKDVPEAVFEPTAQNVEEVIETSSKAGQIEKLNREAPEAFSEPTNQVVEAVNNEETDTPTVAIALTSSKEFQLNGEAEDVTDTVSSEKNIETTGKPDIGQQDEGIEKIIPEDASTSVSDYAHEDVKIESESAKIDEEVGETRTPVTIYEYKDQVVEDAQETDLSSAVDESNINEIAKVEKNVTGELPEAINEDVEAETEGSPDQEITKSIAEVQEAKASVPVIQSKALSVEEMDGFDPTHSNFQGVGTIIDEEVLPNQTLLVQSKEHLMEPCSTLVDDQLHETTTEEEMVISETKTINKNDTRLNEDTANLSEIGTTGNVEQRELEISNSDVTVQDSQNEATEKEIDEESIDENIKYDQGESKLINDQINAFGTSSETTIAETIETVDTTTQDSEVDSTKIQETSKMESQLLPRQNETEACERTTAENKDADNLEAENSEDHNVEEIHETDTSPALGDTETSEIDNKVREAPRVIHQVYAADSSDEISLGQKIQAENRETPEAFSEPTNQVEEVSNDDFVAPTVATELTSSKEFQMDGAPENVTNSSAENIETTEKTNNSQQDEGIVKIVLEDVSTTVSDYVQEDEEQYIDEEVGEASTSDTISEHKDQVVEVARETDVSSAMDESNINEIAKVEKEVLEELPEAVNEDTEADRRITLDQEIAENEEVCGSNDQSLEETREMKTNPNSEITENYKMGEENKETEISESIIEPNVIGLEELSETEPTLTAREIHADEEKEEVAEKIETGVNRSDAEEVQEPKAYETIIPSKAICVEETDELDPTPAIGKMPTNEEREETEAIPAVREIFHDDISPNQTLPIESKKQLTEPFSVSVKDQHHETVTEVEILKPESINKNDTWLNEDTTDLPETGTTETVVQKEVEISNSDVTVQDTQSGETEKVIDEENIEKKMKCDDGADTSATTRTEVTLVGENELVNEPINAFGTSSETTNPGTIETFDVSAVCESSTVDSQLLAHENETEFCDSFTADTDAENVEVENSEVPAAESEFLVHNVEEIHQTDTSPAVEDALTSEVEKAVREVPGVINQVYEADSSDELSHDRKIQAENTVDPVQVSSVVFLPSEESHESKTVTMDDTEDGHRKKDDTEENNLQQLEVTSVDAVKAEETLDVETVTNDEANERPLVIGEIEEERQESSSALLSEKQGETEESKISETKTETNVLGVQDVYESETTADVEKTHADKVEETKEALETIHDPKFQDIGVITDRESVSNQTFPPEIIESVRDGVEDTDIAPTAAREVKSIEEIEPSDEAAKDSDISSESKAPETIEVENIKPEEASLVELTRTAHENKEAHESVTAEKTDADNVEVKDQKVLDAESEYLNVEEIHGAEANPVMGETVTDESEKVAREVPKALPEGNNQGPEADSNDEIIPGWTSQVENTEEEASKLPSIFLSSEESQENVTTTTENTEDESEKVTQDVLRELPEGINQGPEAVSNDQIPPSFTSQAENIEEEVSNSSSVFLPSEESHETSIKNTDDDSLKLQETFGMLSQLRTIETKEASVADEVEAEEAKGSDAIYESKDHLDDIHETKSSPSAEISDEVNMEEATSNEAEKISDVEAIDVPADESTSVSNCPTDNLDIGANITNSVDEKPEEVIISELIPESGVLNVEEIQTETSPSVAKTQDEEEDETKTVLETTFQPDHEDVADIIARYIISNQTFPDENKEDKQKGVEETDILPAAVVEEASIGKINPIDEVVKASCYSSDTETQGTIQTDDTTELKSEINKSQLHEYETEKIADENVVPNVQEIQNTSTSPSLGESDAIGSVNIYDNEETKSCSSVTEPKEQAVEDFHVVVGADMNESDQETREAPKEITKEINQDAGEVSKEEVSAIQHNEVENIEETGFVFVSEAKDQSFEEARDTKTITAAKTPNVVEVEEDGTQVLEQIYGETYTGVEASVDGQTQATRTVPEPVFEAKDQDVGEIISKDINLNDIVQNENKPQQNEPCVALLKDQDQETVVEDGLIKAEDKIQTDVSSNENAIDSFEAGTEVEKSSSKPVDESKESFDLDFEKIEKPLNTDSENIPVSEVDPILKVTDVIDEQLEKSVASMRESESETRIENTTEAAQAIHGITSKETLTEEPEKAEADNPLGEPITADNSNVETPEQVSVGTKSVNAVDAEEEKNGKYAEDKPITEFEGKEYEILATESTRSIEEVKGLQVPLGKPEDKLGDYNEKDETGYTNINNFENRVEKEKMENESHEPACEKNGTKESVGIAEQEPTANVADFPSIKTTTDEELAVKDEIMVDEKQRDFILDPVPINSSPDEKVEKLVMLPTTNKQEALWDVTEPSKAIMEPQKEKKISLSLSQAQIAKKEYLNEEKENKNAIASKDIQVIQEAKHGEEIPEAIEKMTPNDPYEILHKPADQTKQINEEPKTELVEKGLVEEEKTDEDEENEHKRADSGSDAPVMVEASRDIDVKTPHKKSHNILSGVGSKVKHSIAKVKKAITGKSSNQKSSSPKEDKKTEAVPLL